MAFINNNRLLRSEVMPETTVIYGRVSVMTTRFLWWNDDPREECWIRYPVPPVKRRWGDLRNRIWKAMRKKLERFSWSHDSDSPVSRSLKWFTKVTKAYIKMNVKWLILPLDFLEVLVIQWWSASCLVPRWLFPFPSIGIWYARPPMQAGSFWVLETPIA